MVKWLLKAGDGRLLPREVFFTPDGKFRKGHPIMIPPPPPKPPHIPHNHDYRDAKGRLLPGHPYVWKPGVPRPLAHRCKTPPIRNKYGRFGTSDIKPNPPRENNRFVSPRKEPQP